MFFFTRDKFTMITLFNSLVRSKLEFCCEIWSPSCIKDIASIEQVQRSFTFRISKMGDFNYWERLKHLGIMSLQRRRERIILLHLWKIKNGLNRNSISIEFKYHQRSSAFRAILKPLPKIKGKLLRQYDNSFIINSAKLWNSLPPALTCLNTLERFKLSLDRFLIDIPDQPPIPGYPCASDNSLMHRHSADT